MAYVEFLDHSEDYSLDQFFVILSDDGNLQELPDFMREDRYFTCRTCKLTFNSKFEKQVHSEMHRMTFSCHYCANYTGTTEKSDLIEHLKTVPHPDVKFLFCEDCLYFCEQYQKKAFMNHQNSHIPSNLHKCFYPDCGHSTRRKYDLERHMERIHKYKKKPVQGNMYSKQNHPRKKRKIEI